MSPEEQKQQLSFAYIRTIATHAGYSVDQPSSDFDSVDLKISSVGKIRAESKTRSAQMDLQVKATSCIPLKSDHFTYDLPIKNYDDLRLEASVQRFLVVLVLPSDPKLWLELDEERMLSRACAYYRSLLGLPPVKNEKTRSVKLSRADRLTPQSLEELMFQISMRRLS